MFIGFVEALRRGGIPASSVSIVTVATETAAAMMSMHTYVTRPPRLAGLTWGAEDLSTAVGAMSNREEDGGFAPLYVLARSYCLCAAAAAGVAAIDTLHADFRDADG
jgi:citrate lyase subunit beta/citryl-CoA lyase